MANDIDFSNVADNGHMSRIADAIRSVTRTTAPMTIPQMPGRMLDIKVVETKEVEIPAGSQGDVLLGTFDKEIKHMFLAMPKTDEDANTLSTAKPGDLVYIEEDGEMYLHLQEVLSSAVELIVVDMLQASTATNEAKLLSTVTAESFEALKKEVDDLKNSPDVVDIVQTKAALDAYDTSALGDKDIIRVLADETQGGASTYYRWNRQTSVWTYIGKAGDYYTKSEVDSLLSQKSKVTEGGVIQSTWNADTKLDKKTSSGTAVYAVNGQSQVMMGVYIDAEGGSIAQRDMSGRLKVSPPTEDTHAANKQYVENIESDLSAEIDTKLDKTDRSAYCLYAHTPTGDTTVLYAVSALQGDIPQRTTDGNIIGPEADEITNDKYYTTKEYVEGYVAAQKTVFHFLAEGD